MIEFSFIKSAWEFYLISVLIGMGGAIIVPSVMAITIRGGAAHSSMGSVVSLMTAGDNLGVFIGPMLCGAIIAAYNNGIALQVIALFMATMTIYTCFYTFGTKAEVLKS